MVTDSSRMNLRQILIVLLALTTAVIHFSLLFPDVMFILNAVGFVFFAAAMFLPLPVVKNNRRLTRWGFIGYALLTIVLWGLIGERSTLGYITKGVEITLVALLWFEKP